MNRYFRLVRAIGVGANQESPTKSLCKNELPEKNSGYDLRLSPKLPPLVTMARRQFLLGSSGLMITAGGMTLVGCGGSGTSGPGANPIDILPPGAAAVKVSGTVVLPTGVTYASVTLVTGGSELALTQSTFSAQVPGAMPTIACVMDNATGQAIMPCIIDPTVHAVTLDSSNVAGTLIFLSLGGWVLQTSRAQLWSQVMADPATATFAKVVEARLDVDHFAAIDGDAALVAGLKVALSSLKITTPVVDSVQSESAEISAARSIKAVSTPQTSLPALPDPFVAISQMTTFAATNGMVVGSSWYQHRTTNESLTYFQFVNGDVIERTFLQAYVTGVNPTSETDVQIGDPIVVAPNSSTDFMAISLENPEDVEENVRISAVAPIFDAPVFGTSGSNLLPVVQALLVASWERASVGLGADFIITGLGGTVASHDASLLDLVIGVLKSVSPAVSSGITAADGGTNLPGSVSAFLFAAVQTSENLNGVIAALRILSPDLPVQISARRMNQLRSLIRLGISVGLQQLSAGYAQSYMAFIYDDIRYVLPIYDNEILQLYRPTVTLFLQGAPFAPDGTPTKILCQLVANPPNSSYTTFDTTGAFKLNYTFSGSSNVSMSDGEGNSGNSFQSTSDAITLTANGMVTGKQTVSVEVFDVETGSDISIGTASLTIDPAVVYSLDQSLYVIPLGGQTVATVLRNDIANESQWPGVDPTKLSFQWLNLPTQGYEALVTPTNFVTLKTSPNSDTGTGTYSNDFAVDIADSSQNSAVRLLGAYVVGFPLQISPANQTVAPGSQTSFAVSTRTGVALPTTNVTYQWSVTGAGSLAGGNPLNTQATTISYTAPATNETETLTVNMKDATTGQIIGTAATSITVGVLAAMLAPYNPTLTSESNIVFTVTTKTTLPSDVSYVWTLSGVGSIGGGTTVTTTANSLTYTAPTTAGTATLSVSILNNAGTVIAMGSTPITVTATTTVTISPSSVTLTVVTDPITTLTSQTFTASFSGASDQTYYYYWLTYGQPLGTLIGPPGSTSGQYFGSNGLGSYLWVISPTPQVTYTIGDGSLFGTFPLTVAVYNNPACTGTPLATSATTEITIPPYEIIVP